MLEILEEMLVLSAPERALRLEELAVRDPAVRAELALLLDVDASLATRARAAWNLPTQDLDADEDLSGATFDGYRIDRELAHGGMGRVFEAWQEPPCRRVAIKVVRHALATQEILRRFEYEVELLARLDHPNIARVYGAGTIVREGRKLPYFAMELVEDARALDEFTRGLGLHGVLEVFLQVCAAVEHGHQRGVVHRDLKPANVLVGSDGRPKLIDFGVAKAVRVDVARSTMHTLQGELLGTITYMSPEQLDGDDAAIDARTDVYGLGAILYELIALRPPFDVQGLSLARAVEVVRTATPAAPSVHRAHVPRDLDTIVLKALERDRERRYGSVSALAADLRRHLAGEPIEARPPSSWERFARWIARHPVAATAAACALLVATSVATAFTVEGYARTPHHVAIDGVGRVVDLIARNGEVLHSWDAGKDHRIVSARFVERPAGSRGDALVVIAYGEFAAAEGPAGTLCAYGSEPPFGLAWSSKDTLLELPAGERYRPESMFVPSSLLVADILPDLPGEELVLCHRQNLYSATAIRVFDLEGRERYRAWHDGAVDTPAWLAGAQRLLVAGVLSERPWDELRPSLRGSPASYPIVVFALVPSDGHVAGNWVTRAGQVLDPTLAWYRWLGPPEHVGTLGGAQASLSGRAGDLDPGRHVHVMVPASPRGATGPNAGLNYVIDAEGEVVRAFADESYTSAHRAGEVPAFETYGWNDLSELPSPPRDSK